MYLILTGSSCPFNVEMHSPVFVFQTLSVLSRDPETTTFPSGENEQHVT